MQELEKKIITTLRTLSIDQVEAANSGHPGLPLGAAPLIYSIWQAMDYNPKNPAWPNRDRFVLSPGHGSALLYSMLHLSGFDLTLEDLQAFRQLDSKTPGHPEYGHTSGVEATTGPLGHGFATGVGMAIAEKMLAAQYNKPGQAIIDHYIYGLVSDGDLMEGVAAEAASLAGTLGLGKIIYLYDDNKITIEGSTDLAFTENVRERFDAYGWHTLRVEDSEDIHALDSAIKEAQQVTDKPSLILVRTKIGFGCPKEGLASVHGEPLGQEGVAKTKENFGLPPHECFAVPEEVSAYFATKAKELAEKEAAWQEQFKSYSDQYPQPAAELAKRWAGDFALDSDYFPTAFAGVEATSTREASGEVMQEISKLLPAFCGGSADLGPSNKTYIKAAGDFSKENPGGRNLHFGVREHAMTVIASGIALYGGFIPYTATFLVFSDFMRPGIRLAALMGLHSVFVLTHDSVAVGEDGPTHQPIEQAMSLRLIPGLEVWRPADALETKEAWRQVINNKGACALLLSRQKLKVLHEQVDKIKSGAARGGYVISPENSGRLDLLLLATGSEVELCLEAQKNLWQAEINSRVVSLPCWEVFDRQEQSYRLKVLPGEVPVLAIEAGVTTGWEKYTGCAENVIGINSFGISGPGSQVAARLGLTVANIVQKAGQILAKK